MNRIPYNRVLFIGGHEREIVKLKQKYPKWTYLRPEERNSNKVKKNFDLVIAKSDHVSHNIIERALAFISDDVPVIYSNSTNIGRVEYEIYNQLSQFSTRASA